MNGIRRRPLPLDQLRAFEAVARLLNFRRAGDELHLTQSAISRQIGALEDELGASLFDRNTRQVALTHDGAMLLRAVAPLLDRLDASVRQIRQARGRRSVSVTTFASFASLWLIPQMEAFQREHPDIDMRVSASDNLVDADSPDIDLALRFYSPSASGAAVRPPGGAAERLFGEVLTPVASRLLLQQTRDGRAPPLALPSDLALHTLAEEDSNRASAEYLSWHYWLAAHGQAGLQPRRWLYLTYTYQQVQAALSSQGIALARVALATEPLERGELVEPFGDAGRLAIPCSYWMLPFDNSLNRTEVRQFADWVRTRAAATRRALGETDRPDPD